MKIKKVNTWQDFRYEISSELVSKEAISHSLDLLNQEFKVLDIPDSQYINIQYKVKTKNNSLRSFSYMQTIQIKDLNVLKEIFKEYYEIIAGEYDLLFLNSISHIIYTFRIIKDNDTQFKKINLSKKTNIHRGENNSKLKNGYHNGDKTFKFRFNNVNLPTTMDLRAWGDGKIIFSNNYSKAKILKKGGKFGYFIDIEKNTYNVELRFIETGNILYKYTDTLFLNYSENDLYQDLIMTPESLEKNNAACGSEPQIIPKTRQKTYVSKIIGNKNIPTLTKQSQSGEILDIDLSILWKKISEPCLDKKNNSESELSDIKFSVFRRTIKNKIFYFVNGKVVLKKIIRKFKFLSKKNRDLEKSNNFIAMDLETKIADNDKMIPFCLCYYDGFETSSFYIENLSEEDSEDLIITALNSLLIKKYSNQIIYLHNFSYFDSIFLMRVMVKISDDISLVVRNGKIINLILTKDKYKFYFRDSYLLLPLSLSKLCKSLGTENKHLYPMKFLQDKSTDLNYSGDVPDIKYFYNKSNSNITITNNNASRFAASQNKEDNDNDGHIFTNSCGNGNEKDIIIDTIYSDKEINEYNNYVSSTLANSANKNWNLKIETIKYCNQDVISLHQVIKKFSILIWDRFRVDVHKSPTLPSLAMTLYRSNFLKENFKIPTIFEDSYKDLRECYFGGMVEAFKPYGENVYIYDVNSLYPFVMKNFNLPVGNCTFVQWGDEQGLGDTKDLSLDNESLIPFGFLEVQVEAPETLNIPVLPVKFKSPMGTRNIYPLGQWTGTYFSEEIKSAIKIGYKFKLIKGYIFEKDKNNIFSEFVNYFYKMKQNSLRDSSDYVISKLLLNSLYGKFGMDPQIEQNVIIDPEKFDEYNKKYEIRDVIDFKNNKYFIRYFDEDKPENTKLSISVAIAAAITGYGRVFMTSIIRELEDLDYTIYYMDTDSLAVNKPLPEKFIGSEIGKFKLECVYDRAVFLGPKVYGGVINGSEKSTIKGIKDHVPFHLLNILRQKNFDLKITQEKWFRNMAESNILVSNSLIRLSLNENKRKLYFDENNILIDTKPYILKKGVLE